MQLGQSWPWVELGSFCCKGKVVEALWEGGQHGSRASRRLLQ